MEDALLEDMCEIGGLEFDGDPEEMSEKDKMEMVKRLSKLPETEHIFKNEKTFANFVDHQLQQSGPGLSNALTPNFDKLGVNILPPSRKVSNVSMRSRISNISHMSVVSTNPSESLHSHSKRTSTYEMGYKVAKDQTIESNDYGCCCFINQTNLSRIDVQNQVTLEEIKNETKKRRKKLTNKQ